MNRTLTTRLDQLAPILAETEALACGATLAEAAEVRTMHAAALELGMDLKALMRECAAMSDEELAVRLFGEGVEILHAV